MQQKRTLVLGASLKPRRFSYKAIGKLTFHKIPVVAVGLREGRIGKVKIVKPFPDISDIHTVTMYVGPKNQSFFTDFILSLKPVRVIFNPGTENPELKAILETHGIGVVEKCMLVMLAKGDF